MELLYSIQKSINNKKWVKTTPSTRLTFAIFHEHIDATKIQTEECLNQSIKLVLI